MIKVVVFDVGGVLIRFSGPQFKLYRLAGKLKRQGIRVSILSNVIMPAGFILKRLHLYRGFSPVILSYEEKVRKPESEIYSRAVKMLGVKPNEIAFIDNHEGNLEPAKKAGMFVIHATSTSQVVNELKALLKSQNNLTI